MNLYKRWQVIADRFSGEQALLDWKTGRSWTFNELQEEVDRRESAESGTVLFPNGWQVELIFETLRAWRDGAILCPVEGEPPEVERFAGIPQTIAHVKMTSGSTAEPKLVLFESQQLAADAANIVTTMGLKHEWPNLGVISMAHSYGFSNLVTPLLLHGVPLVWAGDPLPELLSAILGQDGAGYTLPAVPAMWRAWLEAGAIKGDAIRLAVSAGAPLSLELENRLFEGAGLKVHNFYGSSECGGIAYDRSLEPRTDASCVGTAMDNVELGIRDSDGCLIVQSEAVGQAYWAVAEEESGGEEESKLGKGQFVTADLAEIEGESGKVYLRSRSGDMINVAGRKVAPGKIEQAILEADESIRCCVVFGIPSDDAERVEDVVACVATGQDRWEEAGVKSKVRQSLAAYEVPRHWWQCQELKLDSRGKVSRREWRDKFLNRQDSK